MPPLGGGGGSWLHIVAARLLVLPALVPAPDVSAWNFWANSLFGVGGHMWGLGELWALLMPADTWQPIKISPPTIPPPRFQP